MLIVGSVLLEAKTKMKISAFMRIYSYISLLLVAACAVCQAARRDINFSQFYYYLKMIIDYKYLVSPMCHLSDIF